MRKFYTASLKDSKFFLLIFFLFICLACFAQEKIPNISKDSAQFVKPIVYSQNITKINRPITNKVLMKTDLPQFIQKFSGDKSALSSEAKILTTKTSPQVVLRQDVLTIEKSDLKSESRLTTIACNDVPIGIDDQFVIATDKALTVSAPGFLANDIDLEGEPLTATVIADYPDHGTVNAFTDGSFVYTPSPGFIGIDQFQYRMQDASANQSENITITIEVLEKSNRNPLGSNDDYSVLAGAVLTIAAPGFLGNDLDQDGDVLTATVIVDYPNHGSVNAFTDGSFFYTPSPGFTGTDQFQYKMQDSKANQSEPVTVTIVVYEGNRKPIGTDDIFGLVQNATLSIPAPGFLFNDIDPDGEPITATVILDYPDNGTVNAFTDGSFFYTPSPGFTGTDQFQYKMKDSKANQSEPVTVTLEVIATGVLPVGFPDTFRATKGSALTVAAPGFLQNDIDQNGEALTAIVIFDFPDNGIVNAFTNGSFVYTPNPGFIGTDQFQYKMQDASANQSDPVTVTILVEESFNRSPIGINDEYAMVDNTVLTIAAPGFLGNDVDQDGDVLTATVIVDYPDHGIVNAFTDGSFVYTPNAEFTGTDQFQYKMQDSKANQSDPVTVTIVVYEGNRKPFGTNDIFGVVKDTPLSIGASGFLANDYDPDGDILTATVIVDYPDYGSVNAFTDGSFVYTPNPGFTGTDQFQYKMQDSEANQSDPIIVMLEVVGPNLPPIAKANNMTLECTGPSGTKAKLDASGSTDPENGALLYTWFENNAIILGPTSSATSDFIFATGFHHVTLEVEDECGQTALTVISVLIEDSAGPLVEAALLPTGHSNEYEISCFYEDLCSEVISQVSIIRIPNLVHPEVIKKNQMGYSIEIDIEKNKVSVKAPNANAFWASIMSNGGVIVNDGQIIGAKNDKNKYKFSFDDQGNLVSVEGNIVTLKCSASDSHGNTSESEVSLPLNGLKEALGFNASNDNSLNTVAITDFNRNYPNPFKQYTTIEYKLETSGLVKVFVFDQLGKLVEQLTDKEMSKGVHQIIWDSSRYESGVYFYQIEHNGQYLTGKMIHQ